MRSRLSIRVLQAGCAGWLSAMPLAAAGQAETAAPVVAQNGEADPALSGHYYLSGVMETGSELLLKSDGRFEWFISYGAVDQFASGRWARAGDRVTLTADRPASDAPLFSADERADWNEAAETRLRDAMRDREVEAIAARCPWTAGAVTSPAASYYVDEQPRAGPAELARAAASKAAAIAALGKVDQAIAAAASDMASPARREAAIAAMGDWYQAVYTMEQAYEAAGLDLPEIGEPAVPPQCALPPDTADTVAEAQWLRGIAVVVGDAAREMRLSRVKVDFRYDDGHVESGVTSNGGWAFAPLRAGTAVTAVDLSLPEPDLRKSAVAIAPLAQGIQAIRVDTRQIVGPAFETMNLRVDGADLVPDEMGRGRYSRD